MSIEAGAEGPAVESWSLREAELEERRDEALAEIAVLAPRFGLSVGATDEANPCRRPSAARLLEAVLTRLLDVERGDATERAELARLVPGLQRLATDVTEHEREGRARRFAACEGAIARLRSLPTSSDLLDQACNALVRHCGFGRAMLSATEGGHWMPSAASGSSRGDVPAWFVPLRGRTVSCGRGSAEDVAQSEHVVTIGSDAAEGDPRPVRSYVVAPLLRDGVVLGLLHADHHPSMRGIDETDRLVVSHFAEALTHLYERAVLSERLADQRDRIREALMATKRMMDDLGSHGLSLGGVEEADAGYRAEASSLAAIDAAVARLTRRERDVLALLVTGAGNHAIAERLVIAPGTVKFHVQNVLRKLGAVNRAQAIASCLHLDLRVTEPPAAMGSGPARTADGA